MCCAECVRYLLRSILFYSTCTCCSPSSVPLPQVSLGIASAEHDVATEQAQAAGAVTRKQIRWNTQPLSPITYHPCHPSPIIGCIVARTMFNPTGVVSSARTVVSRFVRVCVACCRAGCDCQGRASSHQTLGSSTLAWFCGQTRHCATSDWYEVPGEATSSVALACSPLLSIYRLGVHFVQQRKDFR